MIETIRWFVIFVMLYLAYNILFSIWNGIARDSGAVVIVFMMLTVAYVAYRIKLTPERRT